MRKILDEAFVLSGKDAKLNERLKRDYFNWLYMRLSLGPKSEDDIKDFRKDIQDFRDSAAFGRSLSPDYIFSYHDNYRDTYPDAPDKNYRKVFDTVLHG